MKNFPKKTKSNNLVPVSNNKIEIGNKKRNEIYEKLKSLNLDQVVNKELLDSMGIITEKSNEMTIVLNDITNNMNEMTVKISAKTDEMTVVNKISDNRLRLRKSKIVANQLANELDVISDKYEVYIPDFKEHYLDLVHSFIEVCSNYEKYMSLEDKKVKFELIESIDSSIESLTDLLIEMDKVPKITSKYGQAQIRQMKLLKILVEEILFGRELMDQIE